MKLRHYIAEAESKRHKLVNTSPEYFLFTVLPTVEWIEVVFSDKRFSSLSLRDGMKLFKKYRDMLPPLFTAQLSGGKL